MELHPTTQQAILKHARWAAGLTPPEEAVGIIRGGIYAPMENISDRPAEGFAFSTEGLDWAEINAVVHSHPGGPNYPSAHDMSQQMATGVPWVVAVCPTASSPDVGEEIFTFGTAPRLKMDAGYRHGVDDCYSLIRGFYANHMDIALPDFPRGWDWWHDGDDLYQQGLAPAGFSPLPDQSALQVGDVFLAQVRAPVINHAGIWLGHGLILHHLGGANGHQPERLPRKEPAERWLKFINGWVRHTRAKSPLSPMDI